MTNVNFHIDYQITTNVGENTLNFSTKCLKFSKTVKYRSGHHSTPTSFDTSEIQKIL